MKCIEFTSPLKPWLSWALCFSFVVLVVSGFIILNYEKHDASFLIDKNIFGEHACPVKSNKELSSKLLTNVNRPDEDILWNTRLALEASLWPSDARILSRLHENELHYRVEIRRSILEFESKHPLCMPAYGPVRVWPTYDILTGVPLFGGSDIIQFPDSAHEWGREDVLNWYAKLGFFAVNSIKSEALTNRSTRTLPQRSDFPSMRADFSSPSIIRLSAAPVSLVR